MRTDIIAVPFMNALSTAENRPLYLSELKRAGAKRVFICPENSFCDDSYREDTLKQIEENIKYYRQNGLEAGVWFGGFGHGGTYNETDRFNASGFTRIKGLYSGESAEDSICPLDAGYKSAYLGFVQSVARLRPDIIMIDDDLRLSLHGPAGIGCACELHMEQYRRRLGRDITREELKEVLFIGKPNEYRTLWLELMGDTMRSFARELRETVDSVSGGEDIRLGHCACIPTWDTDGIDSIELSYILAGKNRPFLRLIGAAYWHNVKSLPVTTLGEIVELERLQAEWCKELAPDIEIFSECDAYPRPRYIMPAAYLEGFDNALRCCADMDGILKYMFDYNYSPTYETGYVDHHVRNIPLRDEISAVFGDKKAVGIFILEHMHKLKDCEFMNNNEGDVMNLFFPPAQRLCCACSVSITYETDASAAMIFGENAKYAGESVRELPLILDIKAAQILSAAGMDTGLVDSTAVAAPDMEYFEDERIPISQGRGFYKVRARQGAVILSSFMSGGQLIPAAYLYQNASGQRFMVYSFDAYEVNSRDALFLSYSRQSQLSKAYEWLTGGPLPAFLPKNPALHITCKRSDGRLCVALNNFYIDPILSPTITLDRTYKNVAFIGKCSGTLQENKVVLESDIQPYGFAGFQVWD